MRRYLLALAAATAVVAPASSAFAWGAAGHRLIGQMAAQALPPELPAFLRSKQGVLDIGETAREPDRSYASGKAHDSDRDPGHFLDVDSDGTILGGPKIADLPATRPDYDTLMRAAGQTNWKAGYLPYAIVDAWQQLERDFNTYRAIVAAQKTTKDRDKLRFYKADLRRREALIQRDLGYLAHFVGDGSQPLHTSSHFNGWGPGPNPNGYTLDRIHAPFEGERAPALADRAKIAALTPPLKACGCADPTKDVMAYLTVTATQVEPLYQLWKEKAFQEGSGDPRGQQFVDERLAAGTAKLRDLVVDAWRASETMRFGYRPDMTIADIEAGKADPWPSLWGRD